MAQSSYRNGLSVAVSLHELVIGLKEYDEDLSKTILELSSPLLSPLSFKALEDSDTLTHIEKIEVLHEAFRVQHRALEDTLAKVELD